ncbi:MAG: polysaccharide deacetylase family protein [Gemmatimonadales bacterium]
MSTSQQVASISLDLDDLWTYLRTRGDPSWESRPSYLPVFLPEVLELLDRLGLKITFFVVGFDATREPNMKHLRAVADQGHEIGNHSFSHQSWMHLLPPERLEEEIAHAEQALQAATGQRPTGFRGPGYTWSPELLHVLARRQYAYDASTLPTFIGPLARRYLLTSTQLTAEERDRRAGLFGCARDGFRPNKPYRWNLSGGRSLVEIPVTTFPIIRVPFHMSYLLYLSRFSRGLMHAYLRAALSSCKLFGVEPSFLLHPLDLLSGDKTPELSFFPGMDLPVRRKRQLFTEVLDILGTEFEVVTVGAHASRVATSGELARRVPVLAT